MGITGYNPFAGTLHCISCEFLVASNRDRIDALKKNEKTLIVILLNNWQNQWLTNKSDSKNMRKPKMG